MSPETLTALQASIKHWEKNSQIESIDDAKCGTSHCALCQRFYHKGCYGCPIAAKTGRDSCDGTPYVKANTAYNQEDLVAFKKAAQAEIEFLRSLLPQE